MAQGGNPRPKVQAMAWEGSHLPCSDRSFLKDPGGWPATSYSASHQTQVQEGMKMVSPPGPVGVVLGVRSCPESSPGCRDLSLHPSVPVSRVCPAAVGGTFNPLPLRNSSRLLALATRLGR